MMTTLAQKVLQGIPLTDIPDTHFIDGAFTANRHAGRAKDASDNQKIASYDPGSGEIWHQISAGTAADATQAIDSAQQAFSQWRDTPPALRAKILRDSADLIAQHSEKLAVVEALDSGKSLIDARCDIVSVQKYLHYYAGAADKLEGQTIPLGPDFISMNLIEPVGVTAHIVPWNYPISTMMRGVAPALAAGCTAVVKPAETTSVSALMVAQLMVQAGLPAGVCNVVTGLGAELGPTLCQHRDTRHITFTGSVATGSQVMSMAAKNIASLTLELGGKSPAIVLADADIDAAAEDFVMAIYENSGQVCSAGSRLIIHRSVHQEFLAKFMLKARKLVLGHALRSPDIGSINSVAQLQKISGFVDDARARGLDVIMGGNAIGDPLTGRGWFYEPTIIDNVQLADPLVQQEIFGPVLAVQIVDSAEQALSYANGTDFGLAACVYSRDISSSLKLARDLDAGVITVNQYYAGGVSTPFGGTKKSGFGREKGLTALEAYTKVKNVTIKL